MRKLKSFTEAGVAPVYEAPSNKVYNGKGQVIKTRVPARPTEDADFQMTESAQAPTRNKWFRDLIEKYRDLPARYRDTSKNFTAESTDKMTLHKIASYAHECGLQTALKKSVYEWDETWILTVSGFRG